MSDIVERLREETVLEDYGNGQKLMRWAHPLGIEAADTIEALRAENARMYSLLVEAQDYIDDIYDELYIAIGKELERHDLRAARAAMGESDE